MADGAGTWNEYRKLVLKALEDLQAQGALTAGEVGRILIRLESMETLCKDMKVELFGDGARKGVKDRLLVLEQFVKNHPSLRKPADEGGERKEKTDKKMLVLLIGAISGLVALAAKLVDFLGDALSK